MEMIPKTAAVTGAGSGVGRAVALLLAKNGWQVALIGRREEALRETLAMSREDHENMMVCPCDVGDVKQVEQVAEKILEAWGHVNVLVNSAGLNIPNRHLQVLDLEDYHRVIQANLNGAYYFTHAFLENMRERNTGTIVNIVSDAGRRANKKAGASYIISKFGMDGLTQAINVEERENGIRACSIFPGDINTPILDKRPVPPSAEIRKRMIQPEDVAECVFLVVKLPQHTAVEEILVRPTRFTT